MMSASVSALHEKIRNAMIRDDVDPFERSYRAVGDPMVFNATLTAPDLTKSVKGKVSFQYWRNFSRNQKFLEAKSARYMMEEKNNEQDKRRSKTSSSKSKSKIKNRRLVPQDVRQPGSRKSYSFAPPPRTVALFDGHIIGSINPVKTIVHDTCDEHMNKLTTGNDFKPRNMSAPLVLCPGDIGTAIPGGVMTQAPARQPLNGVSATQTASMASTWELDGGDRSLPGGAFASSVRFQAQTKPEGEGSGKPATEPVDPTAYFKGKFRGGDRFKASDPLLGAMPAPGSYEIERLFGKEGRLTSERAEQLIERIRSEKGIKTEKCPNLSRKAVFAYGCSFEEHVKYGLCLDGQCARRASWEDVMMLTNDEQRLSGKVMKDGRKFSSSCVASVDSLPSATSEECRKGSLLDHTPLKSAALSGDVETIVKLCQLGADINETDKEKGQSALHHCVIRGYTDIVNLLTGGCAGWNDADPFQAQCQRLFEHVIDLNVQDYEGDTPLHIASRDGRLDMTEALCDAGAKPDKILNKYGKTASDIAKTQGVFQVITMCKTLRNAEEELARLQRDRHLTESKVRRRLKTMVNTAKPKAASPQRHTFAASMSSSKHSTDVPRDNRLDFFGLAEDEEGLEEESDDGDDDDDDDRGSNEGGRSRRKNELRRVGSFEVGFLPPSEHPCPFEDKLKQPASLSREKS